MGVVKWGWIGFGLGEVGVKFGLGEVRDWG